MTLATTGTTDTTETEPLTTESTESTEKKQGKTINHRDTETQRHRESQNFFLCFSLCLCAFVVSGFSKALVVPVVANSKPFSVLSVFSVFSVVNSLSPFSVVKNPDHA
jgi:hypothetical protein